MARTKALPRRMRSSLTSALRRLAAAAAIAALALGPGAALAQSDAPDAHLSSPSAGSLAPVPVEGQALPAAPPAAPVQSPAQSPAQNSPTPALSNPALTQSAPAPAPAPAAPAPSQSQATLNLSAGLNGGMTPLTAGLRWRIFAAAADPDGAHALIAESTLAQPTFTLAPGDYVMHAAFGLASAAKRINLGAEVRTERLMISAGALKIEGTVADQPIDPSKVSLSIFVPEGRNPEGKLVYAKAKLGEVVGLPEGSYHIVSTYLDTTSAKFSANPQPAIPGKSGAGLAPSALTSNSIVNADIRVPSGKLIDVTLRHRCASLTLKLVNHAGGEALPNTTFTVLTQGGDVIRELMGAFPSLVLAEGEYVAVARHEAPDLPVDLHREVRY